MPPRRISSPKALEELCLTELLAYFGRECLFCAQVRKYQDTSLLLRRRGLNAQALEKELESYLDCLPPLLNENVRQYITNEVLNKHAKSFLSHPEIYVGLLGVVLNKYVKTLEFSDEAHVNFDSAVCPIVLKKCTGLKRFVMTQKLVNIPTITLMQPFLKKVASNCPSLTELVLKDMIEGSQTLSIIGKSCPVLRVLDIAGALISCSDLTHLLVPTRNRNFSIDALLDCTGEVVLNPLCCTLEILILTDSTVKVRGGAFAVKFLPNLVSLGNFLHLAAAIKRVYGPKFKPNPPLKIRKAFYCGPSHTKLKALVNCCPLVETLHIGSDKMRRIAPSCLSYKFLRSLTLDNVNFDGMLECVSVLQQLTELQLSVPGIDVALLGQYCQNLEKLCLTGDPQKVPSRSTDCISFSKLRELKMMCIASAECVGFIVKKALNIKIIDIVRVKDLNDDVFAKWLRYNNFLHLETLMIRYAELTRVTVNLILENCPQLTRLGELGGWDVRSWECRRLKERILQENYDLHLVLYPRNADSIIIDILAENTSSDEDV